ncbi:josephin-2-like [Brevipalpus obovatus]|uniref:josephin-2-like n=1 Tax=Brevipalpus obovatus TaxID=246614 RepID=UPI003D9F07F5
MSNNDRAIYHERQRKKLCALHSLNNLLQDGQAFTQQDLDEICVNLSGNMIMNPHRSMLGIGNYDVNVIMAALQTKGLEAIWFDQRKDPECLNFGNIFGFILNVNNVISDKFIINMLHPANLFASCKHWIALRKINGCFYNLDSKLNSPELIGREPNIVQFLRNKLKAGDCQILIVVDKHMAETGSCYKN